MGPIANRFNTTARRTRVVLCPAALLAALALAGCAINQDQRGNLPDPEKLATIKPGTTTKAEVVHILGSPSSASTFDDNTWYYISRRTEQIAFFSPSVLDQQVFVVDFTDKGVVKDVDHKSLADGEHITPAPGATPAPGRELSFIEQLIGNVGRFGGSGSGASK
jgi:outer membrane protein assembly factor BamE (lipoprotein component of BamABCDE complex)